MKQWLITGALLLSSAVANAEQAAHWTYEGAEGPEHWGELADAYKECAIGKNQSPVNLDSKAEVEAELSPLTLAYQAGGNEVLNNGHTIQVKYEPGSTLTLDGHDYELKQFHFHSPSENQFDGKNYPMEAHLVHADKDGNLAVVAVMFEEGAEANAGLKQFWPQMPKEADNTVALTDKVDVSALLPADHDYYRFNGSLTTPPCTEGVTWLVMKQPVVATADQVKIFADIMGHPNNRPVQPLDARVVMK
ncbi:carbonic anhydrase [Thiothrix nivea]|uniref:carbonic anhydrase n=1 Tax=Thiothrix nivea (strain ATCC 35100 / DSM 5205 / JP2) TaxID=870187 RepID=A0A656HBV7_THINJ|nr:carbonic anhydrase family protein [Thiothrix nivea]EIJ32930.1 carbonic anhydrase [Thiothrix nivea DSM 5205]